MWSLGEISSQLSYRAGQQMKDSVTRKQIQVEV